jgi:hypothetical protein
VIAPLPEAHHEYGKFTISDISGALGMAKEEKTMSRVLNELKKCHPRLQQSAVRNGRVFQYKYYMKGVVNSVNVSRNPSVNKSEYTDKKRMIKEELKSQIGESST